MREAPALAGVTGKTARSKAGPRSKAPAPRRGGHGSLVGRAFARPGVTIAGAAFAALMTGIVANALFLQKGHHPAPLFGAGQSAKPEPAKSSAQAEPPPAPAAAAIQPAPQAPVAPPPPTVQPAVRTPAASAASPAKAKGKPARPAHVDGIGRLLGSLGGPSTAKMPAKHAAAPDTAKPKPKPHQAVVPVAAAPHT